MKRKGFMGCILGFLLLAGFFHVSVQAESERGRGQILYYNFENPDSVVVEDASGNGNDGIIRNYQKGGFQIRTEVIRGVRVQALSLPGGAEGSYLELPDDILDGEKQITVCAWVNLHSQAWYQRIWDFGNSQGSYLYLLSNGNNEGFRGYAAAITSQGWTMEQGVEKGTDFERNTWVFTTVTIREKEITLYENGQVIGRKKADTGLSDLGGTKYNYFGKGQFKDDPMNGELAEVAVYNYAMEEKQVMEQYEGLGEDKAEQDGIPADPDRLLYSFRQNYGVDTKGARPLCGLENPGGLLCGNAVGTCLSNLAAAYREDPSKEIRNKGAYLVGELHRLQEMSVGLGWGEGYLSSHNPEAITLLEKGIGYPEAGAPYCVLGTLLNGLLDAAEGLQLQEAEEVSGKLADWIVQRSGGYTKKKRNRMWGMETAGDTGGLGGALARCFQKTGKRQYLKAAERFVYPRWMEAMKEQRDGMSLLSVSEGISQAKTLLEISLADQGDRECLGAVKYFWNMAAGEYSYATGLPGVNGRFRTRDQAVEETPSRRSGNRKLCQKMLELTWRLHQADPDEREYMNYYERVLCNQTLPGEQMAVNGSLQIIEEKEDALYVNLYFSGTRVLQGEDLMIRMQSDSFREEAVLSVEEQRAGSRKPLSLKLRVPFWCENSMKIQINGKQSSEKRGKDGYVKLSDILPGDEIRVELPFSCYLDQTGHTGEAAVMFGPYVMVTEESGRAHTLVLTKQVTDMVKRLPGAMPSLEINERKFLPYVSSVYSELRLYYHILYTENPYQKWYRVRVDRPEMEGGTVEADSELVCEKESITVTVKPREGYMLEWLKVNGNEVTGDEQGSFKIEGVTEDVVIAASFTLRNPLTPEKDSLEQAARVSAHYTAPWENLEGVKDPGFHPESSNEGMGKGWGNWQQRAGAECWIAYSWQQPVELNTCEIFWYDDNGKTGLPESFFLEYLDQKGQWVRADLETRPGQALKKGQYNTVAIKPLTTTKLRLVMTVANDKQAVGIYRWKVSDKSRT